MKVKELTAIDRVILRSKEAIGRKLQRNRLRETIKLSEIMGKQLMQDYTHRAQLKSMIASIDSRLEQLSKDNQIALEIIFESGKVEISPPKFIFTFNEMNDGYILYQKKYVLPLSSFRTKELTLIKGEIKEFDNSKFNDDTEDIITDKLSKLPSVIEDLSKVHRLILMNSTNDLGNYVKK